VPANRVVRWLRTLGKPTPASSLLHPPGSPDSGAESNSQPLQKRHDREPCPGDGVTAFWWVPSAVVSDIQNPLAAAGAAWARRLGRAHLAMAFQHANGVWATIVINNDLVRVVGW